MSQLANEPMNQSSAFLSSTSVFGGCRTGLRNSRARRLNSSGQCSSHGSGRSRARSTARLDARGRRAHHRWRVEGWPCRIDFSRAACLDTSAMGKSTSARRLHSRGIPEAVTGCPPHSERPPRPSKALRPETASSTPSPGVVDGYRLVAPGDKHKFKHLILLKSLFDALTNLRQYVVELGDDGKIATHPGKRHRAQTPTTYLTVWCEDVAANTKRARASRLTTGRGGVGRLRVRWRLLSLSRLRGRALRAQQQELGPFLRFKGDLPCQRRVVVKRENRDDISLLLVLNRYEALLIGRAEEQAVKASGVRAQENCKIVIEDRGHLVGRR